MLRPYSFQLNSHSSAFHSLNRSLPISFVTRFSIRAIFQLPFVNIPFHFPNASHLQSNSRHYSENELQTLTHPPTHTYLTTDTFNKAAYLHWLSTMAYWNRSGFKKTWDNYKMCIKSPPPNPSSIWELLPSIKISIVTINHHHHHRHRHRHMLPLLHSLRKHICVSRLCDSMCLPLFRHNVQIK